MIEPLLKTSRILVASAAILAASTIAHAQLGDISLGEPDTTPGGLLAIPSPTPEPILGKEKETGTVVTATETATFDSTSNEATFVGSVKVVDPQFELSCDKLTAFLADTKKKDDTKDKPADKSQTSSPQTSSLERIIAEGNVLVVQTRKNAAGEITEYIGKGERGEYDAKSGDFKLTGWPEVQQGINKHVATEAGTVMVIRRDGTMKTMGASKTVIQETTPNER